ncbi:Diadenosine tetraphosphate hydrolase and other HIT family hydrolase [Candidatus Terasakiella magnetica]|nr:Diadenosine tetraphosphate hydrolase and other HIT family hydrolase [Candidatus Terasakiella magnetica]
MFSLHPRLAADTVSVTDWPLCRVLLMNESAYPWLILVPRQAGAVELTDLAPADRAAAMEEVARASLALRTLFSPDRINVGALGNMVPQLHIHVIARFATDAAWPKPVWGAAPATAYEPEAREHRLAQLRAVLCC